MSDVAIESRGTRAHATTGLAGRVGSKVVRRFSYADKKKILRIAALFGGAWLTFGVAPIWATAVVGVSILLELA